MTKRHAMGPRSIYDQCGHSPALLAKARAIYVEATQRASGVILAIADLLAEIERLETTATIVIEDRRKGPVSEP